MKFVDKYGKGAGFSSADLKIPGAKISSLRDLI
jgi:hypothetical protein